MTVKPLGHFDVAGDDEYRPFDLVAAHNALVDVVNALATTIEVLAERVEAIEDLLELGEPEPPYVDVDVKDGLL